MSKPFFYRIDAVDFFTVINQIKSDKELAKFVRQFATDLVTKQPTSDYATQVIAEVTEYINKKKEAGRKGGNQRVSNGQAPLEQCNDFASSETQASKQLAVSSKQLPTTKTLKEDIGDKSPPPSALFNLWNEVIVVPKATVLNDARKSKCRLRLKEHSIDTWREIIHKVKSSPFLRGQNDRGWRADFDWIVENSINPLKVLEGKYDRDDGLDDVFGPRGDA